MSDLLTVTDELLDEMMTHEVKCEADHTDADNRICSGEVTHRLLRSCGMDQFICSLAAARDGLLIAGGAFRCAACNTRISSDWSVIPV